MSLKINPILKSNKIRVGITIGDPSGIGPAITLKAVNKLKNLADFVVIGDGHLLKDLSAARLVDLGNINRQKFSRGKISAEYGRASIEYLDKALDLLRRKEIDCLVTAPISKEAVIKAGYKYGGHTEYFLNKTGVEEVVMLLLNDFLKFGLITRHIPLKAVPAALSKDKLCKDVSIVFKALKNLFGIQNPRLALCSLNPHASENGLIGKEEKEIMQPALKMLRKGINIDGPLAADVAILRAYQGKYDCLIALYHDQALIPLKLTGFAAGANMTLGLPFIRTSPLHGTAFDIAKTPRLADPSSMIAAIKLAIKCTNLKRV
ncbi:MAG: 4-hydroxythreonine-4-phosphate dehydrogenase PdxA [Candidatus Omnitrophica bacterium]|nr:4-hydroxythreonine-4-phosphate dehydrogenase PdxA [Candidatus Omnitrophota bacterium]